MGLVGPGRLDGGQSVSFSRWLGTLAGLALAFLAALAVGFAAMMGMRLSVHKGSQWIVRTTVWH